MLKALIIIVFLVWILWLFYVKFDEAFGPVAVAPATVVCADDTGFCPDGTARRRSGPQCQFPPCQ